MKQTVYIANPESQQIHVWNLNHKDALTLTQIVGVPGQMQPMVVSPDKRCLYVGVHPGFYVLAYSTTLDDDALTLTAESALPDSPTHISIDHQGRLVFVGSYNADSMGVTRLEDGLPISVVDVVEGLDGYHSANISPDNRTLWAPALKQGRICLFTVNDDGHLVTQDLAEVTTVEGVGPCHVVLHPNEQYAYCVNELSSSVDAWELKDPHGNIECIQTLNVMPENFSDIRWATDVHITPDGRHSCVCDRTASLIIVFSVSKDGSVLSKEDFQPTETQSRGFNVDHNGKYLIVAGQKSHHISIYGIVDEQGLLHEKGRYAAGQGPVRVVASTH